MTLSPKSQIVAKILLCLTIVIVFYYAFNKHPKGGLPKQLEDIKNLIKLNKNQPISEKIIIKEI